MALPEQVQANEPLARYIASRSKINWATNRPRTELFMPHPYIELSMFRIIELDHPACVELGQTEYADKLDPPRQLVGWTELIAHQITARGLALDTSSLPDNPQHERHANIRGWPEIAANPKMQKAQHKEIALELSAAATNVRLVEAAEAPGE